MFFISKRVSFYKKILLSCVLGGIYMALTASVIRAEGLLTEPVLQNPGDDSVTIEWFTESEGENHKILLYENGSAGMPTRVIKAKTTLMSRIRGGKTEATCNDPKADMQVWKHTVTVTGLPTNNGDKTSRVSYKVMSDGVSSGIYTLAAKQTEGTPVKILLTSDLQLKNMCAANLEKVYETVGTVDAVLANGDIVDVSDRAYDWFYADNSFYKVMQGRASDTIGGKEYKGAAILQNAPIYTAIGNHDVMGVYSDTVDLSVQFNSPSTREYAEKKLVSSYNNKEVSEEEKEKYIQDNSYNTITYEEMFELPESATGGEKYYSVKIGDVYIIVLDVSRVWRLPNLGMIGKYSEWPGADESAYGYGDFIFESISENSEQIAFLKKELSSDEYSYLTYFDVWEGKDFINEDSDVIANEKIEKVIYTKSWKEFKAKNDNKNYNEFLFWTISEKNAKKSITISTYVQDKPNSIVIPWQEGMFKKDGEPINKMTAFATSEVLNGTNEKYRDGYTASIETDDEPGNGDIEQYVSNKSNQLVIAALGPGKWGNDIGISIITTECAEIPALNHQNAFMWKYKYDDEDLVDKDDKTMSNITKEIRKQFIYLDYAPIAFVSAKDVKRIDTILPLINLVYENLNKRIKTNVLNEVILDAQLATPAKPHNGKRLKIYYASQVSSAPCTIVLFVNDPELMHFSYERYIENKLREAFGFECVPINIVCRKKDDV